MSAAKGDADEVDRKIEKRAAPASGSAKIPPGVMKHIAEHILTLAREPRRRIEAELPVGVSIETSLGAGNLSLVYTFRHEVMGELGHVKAVFGGEGMSLKGLFCGVARYEDDLKNDRAEMMLGIYETAKAAFAREKQA